ncbi:C40 family peptidase [Streptomyces sp. AN091965]|uniref:C40 family peptidase n=1 Tax=Streptomyces sp. AN091965 TaxID=2927803 RepID=UPI001F622C54|nr:C40 family peptidase [Streptomyces sp. AN091965]MCI3933045.1 C40 family peptidase [Streptomyces sp. AN091965]
MSGRLLRWACAGSALSALVTTPLPALPPAHAAPRPAPAPGERSVATLLTDLQRLYRQAEESTETYNATDEKLKEQRRKVADLDRRLGAARAAARDGRGAAGRLARQQYQNNSVEISSYVRLLLARSPRGALDQRHVLRRAAADRAAAVARLADGEKRADALARAAQRALAAQESLARRQERARDGVRTRLREVEELLASLSTEELAAVGRAERTGADAAQRELVASGALGAPGVRRAPSARGERAVRYAVAQIGKPYEWGAEGPATFDCSGLTQRAWGAGGREIPRTSQEQWARLPRVPLRQLRPGDLVVYFPKATHVGLYLGDGLVVHAPRPGAKVKVSPLAANPLLGAVRPDRGATPVSDYRPPRLPAGARAGADTGLSEDLP